MLLPTRTVRVAVAAAAAAVAVTVGLTGCSSDDDTSTKATSTSTSTAAATSSNSATSTAPGAAGATADELKATLVKFSDPAIPTDQKVVLIVNGEARRANIDQINALLATYGKLDYAVSDVVVTGDKATANVVITSPSGTAPAIPVEWQKVDGQWKLTDASGCLLLGFAQAPCVPA
ncbi:hypothetical protein [Nocardia thailandica]|uniref:Low molecular weight antigen MTB12-like C-terminal domain-containing protein n=1 Tax=Nocardia thailandica TaxID=257275 RepID=A0ABW6PNG3_9NOCA|nr:hypothetical protein [Nocardia thailandica]